MAQVVVGEDKETGLQVTVDFFQILQEKKKMDKELNTETSESHLLICCSTEENTLYRFDGMYFFLSCFIFS